MASVGDAPTPTPITTVTYGPPISQETTSSVTLILRSSPLTGAGVDIMRLTLPINPSEVNIDRPSRQTVTQTIGGAYQDHWGEGLVHINIAGTTGWKRRGEFGYDGYQSIISLRNILHEYDSRCAKSGRPNDDVFLYLLLDLPAPKWERFRVSKETASYNRSRSQPLLYMYSASFIALEDLSYVERIDPSPAFIITSYPLPPPPVIVVTGTNNGGSGGNGNGGNGSNSGSNTGVVGTGGSPGIVVTPGGASNGGGTVTGQDTYLDPGSVDNTNGASNDWAATNNSVTLKFAGFYIGPGATQVAATLRDMAVLWYGGRGWRNPGAMWPLIRDTNPEFFLPNATADTRIPALAASEIEPQPSCFPDHLRMPLIQGPVWNYDGDRFMASYYMIADWYVQQLFANSGETPGQYHERNTQRDLLTDFIGAVQGVSSLFQGIADAAHAQGRSLSNRSPS